MIDDIRMKKSHSFFPKMFKVFTLYFFVTFAVFFGYTQIFGGEQPSAITLPTDEADAEDDNYFGTFVSNMMEFQNIDTDFVFSIENKEFKLAVSGNVVYDLATNGISLDVDMTYNEQAYSISAKYVSPNVYLLIDDATYKFDTTGEMDFSTLVNFVSQNINMDMSFIDDIASSIGIDLNNLDLNAIMDKLKIDQKKLDDGSYRFIVSFGNILSAKMICDQDFNIVSIDLRDDTLIKGNALTFSANVNNMNNDEVVVEYEETGEEVDMTGLATYASYAQNLFANDYFGADIKIKVQDKEFLGRFDWQNDGTLKTRLGANVEGLDVAIAYEEDFVYLDLAGLGLKFNINDYEQWESQINTIVEKYCSNSVADIVKAFILKYTNIDVENFHWQTELLNFLDENYGEGSVTPYLPSQTVISENSFDMIWANGLKVQLFANEKVLNKIYANYETFDFVAEFEILQEGFDIEGEFYDVTNMLAVLPIVDDVLQTNCFAGNIEFCLGSETITANYLVNFENELKAEISMTVLGEDVKVYVDNTNVLLAVGEVLVSFDLNNLETYLEKIDEIFGTTLTQQLAQISAEKNVDYVEIIEKVSAVLQELKLENMEGKVAVLTYLANIAEITVVENKLSISFENEKLKVYVDLQSASSNVVIPQATDTLDALLAKVASVKEYVERKQYGFDFAVRYNNIDLAGNVQIDLIGNVYSITINEIGGNTLQVVYTENVVYVNYGGNKVKAEVANVKDLAEIVMTILAANGVETGAVDTSTALTEIFGEDVSTMTLEEILSKVTVEIGGTVDALELGLKYNGTKVLNVEATIEFVENALNGIEITLQDKLTAQIKVVEFARVETNPAEYFDLTTTSKGTMTLSIVNGEKTYNIDIDLKIDLSDRIYVKAGTQVLGSKFEVVILNNMLYVEIGGVVYATDFNNATELYDFIMQAFEIAIPEMTIDVTNILETLDLNATNVLNVAGLALSVANGKVEVNYAINNNLSLNVRLENVETLSEIEVPQDAQDLKDLLAKVANVKEYVDKGIFEFDFQFAYNGLDFAGTIKYFDGSMEICNMVVCDENVTIRLQDNFIYLAYGNMKLKFDISQNGQGQSQSLQEVLNTLTSNDIGVVIDFGVFEEILNILKDYSLEDYQNNILLQISADNENLTLTLSNKREFTVSQILTFNFAFENDKLTNISGQIYDIITLQANVVDGEMSTISPFVPEEYEDYSTDFVAGVLDSLEVVDNVYAFSSDISIRYSTTNFYGKLTAMLVEDESHDGILGKFVPAISIYTTSLGLNSYIYLIDQTVYIDINGLQISADLTKTTIDEILTYIETTFNLSIGENAQALETTTEAFKVILPAIDKVYGTWLTIGNGIKIDIDGDLWYSETSRFFDIVAQLLIENYQNTIVPTKVVLGANIDDPNTAVYDDYSQYLLTNEESITSNLNFAVYFDNISVGNFVENLEETFVSDTNDYAHLTAVKSNYGKTNLADFNSYKTVLNLVDTIYNFATSYQYQFNVDASIESATNSTSIGGDVIVRVGDLADGEENTSGFELFDGKYLNVQGDLDITTNAVRHLISLLYESNKSSALYATYTHGDYIASGDKFRAKINNANLSEIISMALNFANIDIGEEMTNALSLKPNNTDFRYLQSLLGIGGTDVSDDISKVDQILGSVESFTKILKLIKLDKVDIGNDLSETRLEIDLDLDGNVAIAKIILRDELQADGSILSKLREISLENLVSGESTINATILFEDFDETNFDYDTSAEHIDFSEISSFVDVAVNTINTKGFSFVGSANVAIGSWDAITVEYDLLVTLDDQGKIYFYLELDVPSFADVTYDLGGFGSSFTYYSAGVGFDNRISVLEYVDGVLNVTQTTYGFKKTAFNSKETKVKTWSHSASEIGTDIMLIMAEALGLTDTIYNAIAGLIADMNPNPSLEKTILGFAKVAGGYMLKLDGETLTGDSNFADFEITFGLSQQYTNTEGKTYQFIDSVSTQVNIADMVKIPVDLKSSEGTSHTTGDGKTIYTNDYYRKMYIDEARYKKVTFKTYCTNSEYDSLLLTPGEKVVFPNLTTKENTVGDETTYYAFDGWYYDSLFKNPVTEDIYMEDSNLIFYAKWKVTKVEKTSAVNVYNNGEFVTTLRVKSGDTIDLSQFDFVNDKSEFFYDSAYTLPMTDFVMPENALDIYVANKHTVTVVSQYGNAGTFTYNDYQGRAISLPTQETYYVDDGETRTTYTFLGYSEEISTIPSEDKIITANWSVDVKHYYTISFDTTFVYPSTWNDNNNAFTGKITCKQPADKIAPVTVLEGTVLYLTQYKSTAKYDYQAVWVTASYNFEVKSWNTTGCISITDGVSNYSYDKMETFKVTGNTILYAIWGKA